MMKNKKDNFEEKDRSLGEIKLRELVEKRQAIENSKNITKPDESVLDTNNLKQSVDPINSTKDSIENSIENSTENYTFENLDNHNESDLDKVGVLENKQTQQLEKNTKEAAVEKNKRVLKKSKFNGIKNSIEGNSSEPVSISKNIVFDKSMQKKLYQKLSFKITLLLSIIAVAIISTVLTIYFLTRTAVKPSKIEIEYENLNVLSDGRLVAKENFQITAKYNKEFTGKEKILITTDQDSAGQVGGMVVSFSKTSVDSGEVVTVSPIKNSLGIVNGGNVIITATTSTGEIKATLKVTIDVSVSKIGFKEYQNQSEIFKIAGMTLDQSKNIEDKKKIFISQIATISLNNINIMPQHAAVLNLFKDVRLNFATETDRNAGIVRILEDGKSIVAMNVGTVNLIVEIQELLEGTKYISSESFALTVSMPPVSSILIQDNIPELNNLYLNNKNNVTIKNVIKRITPKYNLEKEGSSEISDYMLGLVGKEYFTISLGISNSSGVTVIYNEELSIKNKTNTFDINLPKNLSGEFNNTLSFIINYNNMPSQIAGSVIGIAKEYEDVVAKLKNGVGQQETFVLLLEAAKKEQDSKYAFSKINLKEFFEIECIDKTKNSIFTADDISFTSVSGKILKGVFVPSAPSKEIGGIDIEKHTIWAYVEGSSHGSIDGKTHNGASVEPLYITSKKIEPTIEFDSSFLNDSVNGNYLGRQTILGVGVDENYVDTKFIKASEVAGASKFTIPTMDIAWNTLDTAEEIIEIDINDELDKAYSLDQFEAIIRTNNDEIEIEEVLNADADDLPTGEIKLISKKVGTFPIVVTFRKVGVSDDILIKTIDVTIKDNIKFIDNKTKAYKLLNVDVTIFEVQEGINYYIEPEFNASLGMSNEEIFGYYKDYKIAYTPKEGNPLEIEFNNKIRNYTSELGEFVFDVKLVLGNGNIVLDGKDKNVNLKITIVDIEDYFLKEEKVNVIAFDTEYSINLFNKEKLNENIYDVDANTERTVKEMFSNLETKNRIDIKMFGLYDTEMGPSEYEKKYIEIGEDMGRVNFKIAINEGLPQDGSENKCYFKISITRAGVAQPIERIIDFTITLPESIL